MCRERGHVTNNPPGTRFCAVSRAFFDQVDDELRGLLGPALRHYQSVRDGRLLKLWYGPPPVHFEVQVVGPRWSPLRAASLEIGLHLEHADAALNGGILAGLEESRLGADGGGGPGNGWARALPRAVAGRAIGPRAAVWRRVSEFVALPGIEDPELASEAAETLAGYVRTLWPLLLPLVGAGGTGEGAAEPGSEGAEPGSGAVEPA